LVYCSACSEVVHQGDKVFLDKRNFRLSALATSVCWANFYISCDIGVNVYNATDGSYKGKAYGGESYKVYAEKDGWYDLGNST
jgi:hypothetical protein